MQDVTESPKKPAKFNFVIGNPPYQEDAVGASTRNEPIFNKFMDNAYLNSEKVLLITPARFLSDAGQTPKWWNKKMLEDEHLSVPRFYKDSKVVFPGADIAGGIAITYRDAASKIGPIGVFISDEEMRTILYKSQSTGNDTSLSSIVSSQGIYRFTSLAMENEPRIAEVQGAGTGAKITSSCHTELAGEIFFDNASSKNDVEIIGVDGGKRYYRWIKREYLNEAPAFHRWKVLVTQANPTGFGETLSSPFVGNPELAHTDTFLSVGDFTTQKEAEACLKYLKTKFARALLGILKSTQHNSKGKWKYVPLQDFTSKSDIDWTQSVRRIDQQLYAKYQFDETEISFIESKVKAMD